MTEVNFLHMALFQLGLSLFKAYLPEIILQEIGEGVWKISRANSFRKHTVYTVNASVRI